MTPSDQIHYFNICIIPLFIILYAKEIIRIIKIGKNSYYGGIDIIRILIGLGVCITLYKFNIYATLCVLIYLILRMIGTYKWMNFTKNNVSQKKQTTL